MKIWNILKTKYEFQRYFDLLTLIKSNQLDKIAETITSYKQNLTGKYKGNIIDHDY